MLDLNDVKPLGGEPQHYDLDLVVARLRETADTWVPRLFPNGRRVGDEWRLANICGGAPRNTGSCVITLRGPHAGDWIDFDGNQGGGPISAIAEATGLDGRALIIEAADMAGVAPGAPERRAPTMPPPVKRDAVLEIAHILSGAQPITGSPAERYLTGRGLSAPNDADLLFHPDLTHWETKTGYPALLGRVRDRNGDVIGLHRTYLAVDDASVSKAPITKPRMMLGRVAGGAVRLGPIGDGDRLALCEGIETGLAVMTARPDLPVWATLSTSGLEQIDLPPNVPNVLILADHDASGAGLRAADSVARRLRAEGRDVAIALPPKEGDDFNDLLLREGPAAVAQAITDAKAPGTPEAVLQVGQHRPLNYQGRGDTVPVLRADEGDLARANEQVWSLLMASNRTPWVFRFAGQPTWVVPDDEGRPVATIINEDRLRHMLARLAHWVRLNAKGELTPAPPPVAVVKSVLATPDPALPVLVGIVNTPVFGRSGTLITAPGYHPDARLLYVPAPGFTVPAVSARPSEAEIAAARILICDDLLGDFPFIGPAERAHAVALLLLGFLRGMIDGPTPLHLIEKPTPGSGATLMVDAIATILTGAGASVMTEGRDDDEWRKRVTAKLRQIPAIVLIDNLRNKLDSAAVAAALTAPFWEDRILGASEMARLPIRCLWIATGNNPEFSNEMARRLVRIRLDAHVERPWQRTGFRHPDLMTWVRANRARLVAACLTLCQAWIAAGRPRGAKIIGSFENWAHVIGGVLDVARVDGFLNNLDEMMEASDSEGAAWRAFVSLWWDRFGTAQVGAIDLFEIALGLEPSLPLGSGNDQSRRVRLGKALSKMRDRIFHCGDNDLRLASVGKYQGAARWRLELATSAEGSGSTTAENPVRVPESREGDSNNPHENRPNEINELESAREGREGREYFPDPYACAGAHARTIENPEKPSRHSPPSQGAYKTTGYDLEGSEPHPHHPNHPHQPSGETGASSARPPLWLTELDP